MCGEDFEPVYRNGILVSRLCYSCIVKKSRVEIKKKWNKEKKEIKERLKTHSDWLNDLQKLVNEYVRLRDKNMPCISCGKPLHGKFDAGHFYSVGGYPNVRYHLDNIHGQCVSCNRDKHGNIIEYAKKLPYRIGKERFKTLKLASQMTGKLTTYEVKEEIKQYKSMIKDFKC
jgi:hypothetical protein